MGVANEWFASYLSNRVQFTAINNVNVINNAIINVNNNAIYNVNSNNVSS